MKAITLEARGPGQVNRADLLQRAGFYGRENFGDSSLPGQEIAGQVVAVGSAVTDVQSGDRVIPNRRR
jgi:NADPH:quinone reductase